MKRLSNTFFKVVHTTGDCQPSYRAEGKRAGVAVCRVRHAPRGFVVAVVVKPTQKTELITNA